MKLFSLEEMKFAAYLDAVKRYLSKTLSDFDTKYGNSTVFGQLVNVISGTVQNIMLYIEDALTEQNKYTAQRKKSVYGLAALSGYQPGLGKATNVQIKMDFSPTNSVSNDIIINNKQKLVCTQNGLYYNIILPQESMILSINKNASTKYLTAVQGKWESQQFVVSGGKYYTQHFDYSGNIDTEYITVTVNNKVWTYKPSVYDMDALAEQYTYKVGFNGGLDLIFGNGANGKPLENGDTVVVEYLIHDGELGNLDVNTNTYFVFDDPLYTINGDEIDGNNVFNVTFASNDSVSSGANSETTSDVRQMIGLNSRSLVLATPDNYKEFLSKFSFVGYNRTWCERGSLYVNSIIMKNYKMLVSNGYDYFNLLPSDFSLTESQKSSLIKCLEDSKKQMAGISYNIISPELCKYAIFIYIKLKTDKYDPTSIERQIKNILGEFFCNIESDLFIPKSDIIHAIKTNVSDIDSIDLYLLSEKNETAMQTGYYEKSQYKYNQSTGLYDIIKETVPVYPGENPNLGFDVHGNIYLESDFQFPVLMGGWDFLNKEQQEVKIIDPVTVVFE